MLEAECVTTFEAMLRGASIDPEILVEDYHTPISVVKGEKSLEEVNELRRQLKYIVVNPLIFSPDQQGNISVGVSLEEVDPNTRKTVKDPRVLGIYDPETDMLKEADEKDLNKKFYQRLKENTERFPADEAEFPWAYVRDGRSYVETEFSGEPETE